MAGSLRPLRAGQALGGGAVEQQDHGAVVVVVLGAVVEDRLDGVRRDAALLRADGGVVGQEGSGGHGGVSVRGVERMIEAREAHGVSLEGRTGVR